MALVTNPTKKRPLSILASDLTGNISFDATKTIPAMDITSNEYNEGMSLYLQKLGINKIDAKYNEAVKQFEMQLEEQELAARLQANMVAESSANINVEAQTGLGTGASAVAAEGRRSALDSVQTDISENIVQSYQTGMQNIAEQYQSKLESILGKYDEATGTFANLANYENMSNKVNEAMFKVLALMIDPTVDTLNDSKYISLLTQMGFIEESKVAGEYIISELGQEQIDMLVNSTNVNEPQEIFGGNTLANMIATEMAKQDYNDGYISEEGLTSWESLSSSKRSELITKYKSWIYNNQDNLRLTAWNLYEKTDTGFELDKYWETPNISSAITGLSNIENKGTHITQLTTDMISDCDDEELVEVKNEILSGTIPDGSYFTFQRGKMYNDDKYYYVKNGVVFETNYTAKDPPPIINVDNATIRSFGNYDGAGQGGDQDAWVQAIIDSAQAGRIPDETYINMNLGESSERHDWYQFIDGQFIRITNTEAENIIIDPEKGLTLKVTQQGYYQRDISGYSNVIQRVGTSWTPSKGVEYIDFDW